MSIGNWSLLIGNDMGVWNRKDLVLGKIWLWILLWKWQGRGAKSCQVTAGPGAGCSLPEVKREYWRLEWVDVLKWLDVWMYTLSSYSTCWQWAAGSLTDESTEKSTTLVSLLTSVLYYLWPVPSYQSQARSFRKLLAFLKFHLEMAAATNTLGVRIPKRWLVNLTGPTYIIFKISEFSHKTYIDKP